MKRFASGFALVLVSTAGLTTFSRAERPDLLAEPLPFDWVALSDDLVIAPPDGSEPLPLPGTEGENQLRFPSVHRADRKFAPAQVITDEGAHPEESFELERYTCGHGDDPKWQFGGWVQHGVTFNSSSPSDRFNGPVIVNDRSNEWQMNQLWFYLERYVEIDDHRMNWGGRVDLLYGTDAEFFQMEDGLEESWDQSSRFYQFTPLRFYVDYGGNGWLLRAGRFDAPMGYEPFEATESFFYSRSYTFLTQPGSLLGATVTRQITDQFAAEVGIHRGSDQFNDTDGRDAIDFVGGVTWENDENSTIDAYLIAEEKGPDLSAYHYALIASFAVTSQTEYAVEWYSGWQENGGQNEWYGLNQQMMRELNDDWSVGFRFEWFRDDDGFAIRGLREGNGADGPFVGNFYAFTLAANYSPTDNFALRPELRWDWYDADDGGPLPFDDQTSSNQLLGSLDMIFSF